MVAKDKMEVLGSLKEFIEHLLKEEGDVHATLTKLSWNGAYIAYHLEALLHEIQFAERKLNKIPTQPKGGRKHEPS